jgi:uncharacterized protein (TIGR03435 family)
MFDKWGAKIGILLAGGSMIATLLVCVPGAGGQAAVKMEFDVASVKQNKSGLPPEGMEPKANFPLGPGSRYTPNGGTFSGINLPLSAYVLFAYDATVFQARSVVKQLPEWARSERYDIVAKTDKHDATKEEMRAMMRSLLEDRFKLVVHHTPAETPVYVLELERQGVLGPKLRVHPADSVPCSTLPTADRGEDTRVGTKSALPPTIKGGFPLVCGGGTQLPPSVAGRSAIGYRDVEIKLIASSMQGFGGLDRPVVDATGLTGKYDFAVEFRPELKPDETPPDDYDVLGPVFRKALLEQTGLKLVAGKSQMDDLVIGHLEHASAN